MNLPTAVDIDNVELESINDNELIDIEKELDDLQNLMPCTEESAKLQDELCKVETEYYNKKAEYFEKLAENTKIKRTLMILKARKLQLEINNFRKSS